VWSLGAVSFLNARPLLDGLDADDAVRLSCAVPAALPDMLARGAVDVAMLPVIDLLRGGRRLQVVSDGCIASESETLTVRVFSRMPPDRITHLHADPDSHTSVVLARVLWRELYHRQPEIVPWSPDVPLDDVDAVLLIGDKVVTAAPRGFGFEVDLGGAWRHLTGLPFVFAVWAGRADRDFSALAATLAAARDRGVARAAEIAEQEGPVHGWPVALARRYLCETLRYRLTADMRAGMERFFELAHSIARSLVDCL
jgi:chorismate dehydratase